MAERALFLDRDGVINEEVGYLIRTEDARFVAGIFSLCRAAQTLGYKLIVVTNQAGIARGLYTEEDFQSLMQWIRERLAEEGITLDRVFHCPDHPEYSSIQRCPPDWRKPGPGMLLAGAKEFNLDMAASVFLGDRCSDIAAGNAAGIGAMLFLTGTEDEGCTGAYQTVTSLAEVEAWIVARG